jgi:hypothetical protein
MSGFYLFLSSEDSVHVHKNNNFADFITEFDREIVLEEICGLGWRQQWSFALTDISIDYLPDLEHKPPESVIVLCDLAVPSYINNSQVGVIRTLNSTSEVAGSLYQCYYIATNKARFNNIRIQLKNTNLEALDRALWVGVKSLKCILHFQRN